MKRSSKLRLSWITQWIKNLYLYKIHLTATLKWHKSPRPDSQILKRANLTSQVRATCAAVQSWASPIQSQESPFYTTVLISCRSYLSRRTFRVSDLEDRDAIIGFRGGIDRLTGFISWIQPIFRKTSADQFSLSRYIQAGQIPAEDILPSSYRLN